MNNTQRSKGYIIDALFMLMKKKKYDTITVTDIAKKAGVTRITFYRNFINKDDIIKQHLKKMFSEYKWNDNLDIGYQIFDFFAQNKTTIDLLYKSDLQFMLIDNILLHFKYKKDEPSTIAYSKVMVAYMIFGLCDEWYKRGMTEKPEDILKLSTQRDEKSTF